MPNESLPRLPTTDEAAVRINRTLAEADAEAANSREDCLSAGERSDWSRWVKVTFDGSRYLSIVEFVDFYCAGAAHPVQFQTAMTFDRRTGQQVSWDGLLGGAKAEWPDGWALRLSLPLRKAFLDAVAPVPADCVDVLAEATAFQLWLDGPQRSLAIKPVGLAYVFTPCADTGYLPADVLQDLGADPALLSELSASTPFTALSRGETRRHSGMPSGR